MTEIYCLKCQKKVETNDTKVGHDKRRKKYVYAIHDECGKEIRRYVKND